MLDDKDEFLKAGLSTRYTRLFLVEAQDLIEILQSVPGNKKVEWHKFIRDFLVKHDELLTAAINEELHLDLPYPT